MKTLVTKANTNAAHHMDIVAKSALDLEIEDFNIATYPLSVSTTNIQLMECSESSWSLCMERESKDNICKFVVKIHGFPEELKHGAKVLLTVLNMTKENVTEMFSSNDNFCSEITKDAWPHGANSNFRVRADLIISVPKTRQTQQMPYEIAANKAHIARISKMFKNKIHTDYTFVVKGDEFKVHKNILAAVSEVWEKMFSADFQEKEANSCTVDNVEPEVFKAMLEFIYCAEIPKNFDENVVNLFEAAHLYQIESLEEICLKKLRDDLSITNAVQIYKFAHRYELALLSDAWKVIKCDILKFFSTDGGAMPTPEKLDEIIALREKQKEIMMGTA